MSKETLVINGVTIKPSFKWCENAKSARDMQGKPELELLRQSIKNVMAQLDAMGQQRISTIRRLPGLGTDFEIVAMVDEDIRAAFKILGRTTEQHMQLCAIWKNRREIEERNATLPPGTAKTPIPELPDDLRQVVSVS